MVKNLKNLKNLVMKGIAMWPQLMVPAGKFHRFSIDLKVAPVESKPIISILEKIRDVKVNEIEKNLGLLTVLELFMKRLSQKACLLSL